MKTYKELLAEVKEMEPVVLTDLEYFNNVPDPTWEAIENIINQLPNVWKDDTSNCDIATNGVEILFKNHLDCEYFADAVDEHVFGSSECHTGYYDPEDDERNDEVDANTGWYYMDFGN